MSNQNERSVVIRPWVIVLLSSVAGYFLFYTVLTAWWASKMQVNQQTIKQEVEKIRKNSKKIPVMVNKINYLEHRVEGVKGRLNNHLSGTVNHDN